jgi:hypothetical protein
LWHTEKQFLHFGASLFFSLDFFFFWHLNLAIVWKAECSLSAWRLFSTFLPNGASAGIFASDCSSFHFTTLFLPGALPYPSAHLGPSVSGIFKECVAIVIHLRCSSKCIHWYLMFQISMVCSTIISSTKIPGGDFGGGIKCPCSWALLAAQIS